MFLNISFKYKFIILSLESFFFILEDIFFFHIHNHIKTYKIYKNI